MHDFYRIIARLYDSEHHDQTDDLALYEAVADRRGAPILIVGSGTGRALLHLAEAGHETHGIEREDAMRLRAAAHLDILPHLRDRVTLHAGDALQVALDTRFKLIVFPYNTFMHFLTLDTARAMLRRARGWLERGGALLLDLPNPGEAFAGADSDALTLERQFTDQETGDTVMQFSTSHLDRAAQIMDVTWVYDAVSADGMVRRTIAPTRIRYYFRDELALLLEACGFTVRAVYGDFDESPYQDGAPRLIVEAT
ncbi:MAG: class I SAM-dependent methyltransferase [Chloroflexota bacterium]|nr:class I SAM-dependent methyltransferase [Chloroflexota bacterium]